MKKILISFLATIFLYSCNGPQTVQTQNPAYPNGLSSPDDASYPNLPSYANQPVTVMPISDPYSPQPGDINLTCGNVFIENSDLLIMESYPVQIMLVLKGELPTPCNRLRVITNPPDEENQIRVEVYSVIDPDQMCAQVLEPFEANIGLGSFPSGHNTVWVNGESIGEFDA